MKTGSCGCAGLRGAAPCGLPLLEIVAALFARNALVIGEIVGLAHEGVDGADGVAARLGKGDEGVVEILGFAFGDGPAGCVGLVQCDRLQSSLASSRLTLLILTQAQERQKFAAHRAQCKLQLSAF